MSHHLSNPACGQRHRFIHTRIHASHVFLRIADMTVNGATRNRCVSDALNAYGDAIGYLEADCEMTGAERHDIEAQLEKLHRALMDRDDIFRHVN